MINKEVEQFWNDRSDFGQHAGSNDFILKQLELKEMLTRVPDGSRVLDIGSGNGETLCLLAEKKGCTGVGVDFAEKLVAYANEQASKRGLISSVEFQQGNILELSDGLGEFDVVISERCMINLANNGEQKYAFGSLRSHIKPGGMFLMFENSIQGLAENNKWREMLGISEMEAPWHNHYLDEDEVASWETEDFQLNELVHFSSTYHFLSRVIYARLAQDTGEELCYDSPINMLSPELLPIGKFGPTKLWMWSKEHA